MRRFSRQEFWEFGRVLLGAQAKFETDSSEGSCGKQIDWAGCERRMPLRRDKMQRGKQSVSSRSDI
jgi:hypothetical protein